MQKNVLAYGTTVELCHAALNLADNDVKVELIIPQTNLDYSLSDFNNPVYKKYYPDLVRLSVHPNVKIYRNADINKLSSLENKSIKVVFEQQSNYIDYDKCSGCNKCAEACPVNDLNCAEHPIQNKLYQKGIFPYQYQIQKKDTRPCKNACPLNTEVQGYIALIAAGKYKEAYDLILSKNPFPGICGRVCTHPCEQACSRGEIDEPLAIAFLKRFTSDWALKNKYYPTNKKYEPNNIKVAIIGAGPAGLTCAKELIMLGYSVTIFEKGRKAGGMMRNVIPEFRLPTKILDKEIDNIINLGVNVKYNKEFGKNLTLSQLKEEGYKAIFISTGLQKGVKPGITGENKTKSIDAINFLKKVKANKPMRLGKDVVIVGGGNAAMDAARTAIRLGPQKVIILYRRTEKEMPANFAEIAEAKKEGVRIMTLAAPVKIIENKNNILKIECIRMKLGKPDSSGRRRPVPVQNSNFYLIANAIIWAIGQQPNLMKLNRINVNKYGRIEVNPETLQTSNPRVFAGGDIVRGPSSIIRAIADGKHAASSMNSYLSKYKYEYWKPIKKESFNDMLTLPENTNKKNRVKMPTLPLAKRFVKQKRLKSNFVEVDLAYTEKQAVEESKRCLNCGICSECNECVKACNILNAVDHENSSKIFSLNYDFVLYDKKHKLDNLINKENNNILLVNKSNVYKKVLKALEITPLGNEIKKLFTSINMNVRDSAPLTNNIGIIFCQCGGNISSTLNYPKLQERLSNKYDSKLKFLTIPYLCSVEFAEEISKFSSENQLSGMIVSSCACCSLNQICYSCTPQRIKARNNTTTFASLPLNKIQFVNVREQVIWMYKNEKIKMQIAEETISAGLKRLQYADVYERQWKSVCNVNIPSDINVPEVIEDKCRGCGTCYEVCGLEAVSFKTSNNRRISQIDPFKCEGCGNCLAKCPNGSIIVKYNSEAQIDKTIGYFLNE